MPSNWLRDHCKSHTEERAIRAILREHFELSDEELDELVRDADDRVEQSTALSEFTGELNRIFSAEQKAQVVEYLWQVAFSDQYLDKFEEYTIRKVADLLYVPHRIFIQAKHRAQEKMVDQG